MRSGVGDGTGNGTGTGRCTRMTECRRPQEIWVTCLSRNAVLEYHGNRVGTATDSPVSLNASSRNASCPSPAAPHANKAT